MKTVSIYEYSGTREFLFATLQAKQRVNPRFSLRAWSKQLGLGNPMVLSRVFRNQTRLKPSMARKIAHGLLMPPEESKYFEILSLYEMADSAEGKEVYQDLLSSLRPELNFSSLEIDRFRVVSDWYYFPILEMTFLKGFRSDPKWIAERLGYGVSAETATLAIERLVRLGLMKRDDQGSLKKAPKGRLWAGDAGFQQAIQAYHAQMLDRAKQAMISHPLEERSHSSITVPVKRSDYPKMEKIIQKFNRAIARCAADTEEGEEIYHVNVQMFRATEKEGER